MFRNPCRNCFIKAVCTEMCMDFNNHVHNLTTLGKAAQDQYYNGSSQVLTNNAISYMKGDLVDILRTDPRAKDDTDLYELVHTFNEMYKQYSLIIHNIGRKAHGNNATRS